MLGIKTIHLIPLLALLGASWAEERPVKTSGMIGLTLSNGKRIGAHAAHIYAVHLGERRSGDLILTRVFITGRKPFLVKESVNQIIQRLAGDWIQFHLAIARNPVYIDANEISTVEDSTYKRRGSLEPFSEILFVNGGRIRVREAPQVVRQMLGVPS